MKLETVKFVVTFDYYNLPQGDKFELTPDNIGELAPGFEKTLRELFTGNVNIGKMSVSLSEVIVNNDVEDEDADNS